MSTTRFKMTDLFPEYEGKRRPLPNQEQIFRALRAGQLTGGGAVYCGGKGSGKTIMGAAWDISIHHVPEWQGCDTLIGRETYPALKTSTEREFFKIVERLPDGMVKRVVRDPKAMSVVEWAVGGATFLCSLSNSDAWESANLGGAWADEAHRQDPQIVGDLETRLRSNIGPRAMLLTSNPAAQWYGWRWANPESRERRQHECLDGLCPDPCPLRGRVPWLWVQASSRDNPTLPPDYIARLIARYGFNTPAYRRWVLGDSAALEGSVFTEFIPHVEDLVHVVPAQIGDNLPRGADGWTWGRGMDYGMVNPTAVVWGAWDPCGNLWVDRLHYRPEKPEHRHLWSVEAHAEVIRETDALYDDAVQLYPADPSMFAKLHTHHATGALYSTADKFFDNGVMLTRADNDRESGLSLLLDLMAVQPNLLHPVTLELGSPKLFLIDRECNEPWGREFQNAVWARPEGTTDQGRPDDIVKKDDHAIDATRYLAKEDPTVFAELDPDEINREDAAQIVGSRGQRRAY